MARGLVTSFVAVIAVGAAVEAKPPTLDRLFPAGAARGQTLAVAATGTFDHWPAGAWADGGGVSVEADAEKGKLSIRVAPDAEPGVRWVRLFDEEGATELRPFVVGTLREVDEAEPNNDPDHPQPLPTLPTTVNGRLGRTGDVDGFLVALTKGRTLVADVEANRHLGSPMDAVLQVVSAAGFVLAQNDDHVGRDPRIVFEAPADGTYLVRLFAFPAKPDSSIRYAGGEAFLYRLTLTTDGFLDFAFPPAVPRDAPGSILLDGPNIPEAARRLAIPTLDDGTDAFRVSHPLLTGTAEVAVVPGPVEVEAEPNDPTHPQPIAGLGVICGRIDRPGDRDAFILSLKNGEQRRFRVESRVLGLPLDPVLRVIDGSGKILAESDDVGQARDPSLSFTAPADGDYRVVIRDVVDHGGPRHAYILHAHAPEPEFTLSLAADRFDATPGETTKVAIAIGRKDGFSGPIEVVAEGLPDGLSCRPATSRPDDTSAKSVTLELVSDGCSHPGPFRVVGTATGPSPRSRTAGFAIPGFEAKTDRPWVSIRPSTGPSKP